MTWIDRLALRLRGRGRTVRPPPGPMGRSFAAGAFDRLTADWSSQSVTADQAVYGNLKTLRARSREQWRNNDYARRFVSIVRGNVVGPNGIGFQSRVRDEGPRGGEDRLACDAIEAAWKDWGRRDHADVCRRMAWPEIQRLTAGSVALDGEAFLRILSPADQQPYRFALSFIDPDQVDVQLMQDLGDGRYIRMGIEYDALGRAIAYHVIDRPASANPAWSTYPNRHLRIDAADVVHVYLPELVGQSRGLPWMATALLRLKMLGSYDDAALIAARVGAAKMGFYKSEGEPTEGEGLDGDGVPYETAEPGSFGILPKGMTLEGWSPDYPRGEFGAFVKAMLRGIAAGVGVTYHSISNDLEGVNFSSIRAGVIEEREAWKTVQDWLIDSLCRPVFERWLARQLILGTIRVPSTRAGGLVPLNVDRFEKYRAASWQPRRWAWVDPSSDMAANREAVDMLLTSRGQIIREQGGDPVDLWEEIAAERKAIADLGLGSGTAGGSFASAPGRPDPGPETEDDPADEAEDTDEAGED